MTIPKDPLKSLADNMPLLPTITIRLEANGKMGVSWNIPTDKVIDILVQARDIVIQQTLRHQWEDELLQRSSGIIGIDGTPIISKHGRDNGRGIGKDM